ncbi:uncharacterized protein LOC132309798 isoform X2 [Cornus florida]|nr:uncharacterized protein LOC132309798 isoform X2 [Cornus florida]
MFPPILVDSMKGAVSDLSLEENKITELAAHESSEEFVEKDSKKGLWNVNSLPHSWMHVDSSLEQNTEIGKGNSVEEICSYEIPELVAHAEKDSSIVLLCHEVHQSNQEEKWDGQIKLLTPSSFEGCNSSLEEGRSRNIVNATTNITTALTLASSALLVGSIECEVPESGLTSPSDFLSAVSRDTEEEDDHVIKPGIETFSPYNGLKLEDSCIFVDRSEMCSIPPKAAIPQSHKKNFRQAVTSKLKLARKQQDRDQQASRYAGQSRNSKESFAPSTLIVKLESSDNDFCESEWEII